MKSWLRQWNSEPLQVHLFNKKTLRCLAALLGLDEQRKFLSGFASVWRLTESAVIGLRALGQITVVIAMSLGGKLLASSHGYQEGCIF